MLPAFPGKEQERAAKWTVFSGSRTRTWYPAASVLFHGEPSLIGRAETSCKPSLNLLRSALAIILPVSLYGTRKVLSPWPTLILPLLINCTGDIRTKRGLGLFW